MDTLRWREQGLGERVLRIWLGGTFTYAGIQKLTDHGFLHQGSATYIGTQLDGFAQGSPIAPLLHLAGHAPVLTGIATAMTEILIGLATLSGVAPAVAATVGLLLSTSLWLSASWHVHPYFLGSDSIYAIAWLAYLLMLPSVRARVSAVSARRPSADAAPRPDARASDDQRRNVLRGLAVIVGALAVGGVSAFVGRSRASTTTAGGAPTPIAPAPTASDSSTASASPSNTASSEGPVITSLANLQSQGSVDFKDAATGASILVSLGGTKAAAYSSICTHAGCTVGYDPSTKLIVCPCHGSTFDPADGAKVINGPAPRPLPSVPIVVDSASGDVRQA